MLARQVSVPNRLLAALPRTDYRRLLPRLEPVKLAFGKTLYESHSQIQQVYFPNDCFVSMLTTVDADRAAEVGLIGSEGMIGVPMALGVAVSPFRAVVQGEGTAMRMTTADFRRNFSTSVALKREVFLFTHLLMTAMMIARIRYALRMDSPLARNSGNRMALRRHFVAYLLPPDWSA